MQRARAPLHFAEDVSDGGLVVQGAVYATRDFGVALELSGYNNSWDESGVSAARTNHARAILAGPVVTTGTRTIHFGKDTTAYRAGAHVLVAPEASDVVPTRLAWQPGVAFDAQKGISRMWTRIGYDYRLTRGSRNRMTASLPWVAHAA